MQKQIQRGNDFEQVMLKTSFTFIDHDGHSIYTHKWAPGRKAKAAVQISHGMQEYAGRYNDTAKRLVRHGYIVYANDHRGHGKTARSVQSLGELGSGGWRSVVRNLGQLTELIQLEHHDLPVFLIGHSWGSFLAQACIQRWGDRFAGIVLSGTNGKEYALKLGNLLARQVIKLRGSETEAKLLRKLSMDHFNRGFGKDPSGAQWLTRDIAEQSKYLEDPLCGAPFPNSFFKEMFDLLETVWRPENERAIPKALPILILAGTDDPVGHKTKGIRALMKRYAKYGLEDVTHKFYEGGRHELFNDLIRDVVYEDLIAWLDAKAQACFLERSAPAPGLSTGRAVSA